MSDEQLTLDDLGDATTGESSEATTAPRAAHIEHRAFGDLPDDWTWEKSEDHLKYIRSGISESQNKEGEGLPVSRIETIADGVVNHEKVGYVSDERDYEEDRLKKGDLLFSNINSRDEIGKTAIYRGEKPLYHGMNLLRIRYKSESFNHLFAYYVYDSPMAQDVFFRMSKAAVGQSSINQSQMEKLYLPHPSIKEQRRIASVLYTIDQAIQKTEKIIEQVERILTGVANELLINGIGEKSKEKVRVYSFEFEKPVDWEIVELQKLNKDSKSICYGIVQPGEYYENGVPLLNIEHAKQRDGPKKGDLHRVNPELHKQYSRSKIEGGEIVISVKGSTGDIGRVPPNIDEWNISRDLARISPKPEVDRDWLRLYLSTDLAQKFIHVNSPGSTRDSLNIKDLKQLPVLLPPESEQSEISSIISTIEEKLQHEMQYSEHFQRLKQGLMQDLLSGEVRTHDKDIDILNDVTAHG